MTIRDTLYLVLGRYVRRVPPQLESDLKRYILEELRTLETTLTGLSEASLQVVETVQQNARIGTVRYFKDVVIGTPPNVVTATGLHVYTETGWEKLALE
jgi:hypothetical protein